MTAVTPAGRRPRDSQATKESLLAAATEEFADHGLAGARVDRIAARAGVNKRLLYVYLGDKDDVFRAVMEREVDRRAEAVPFSPHDLGGYAGASFDYLLANPHVLRLTTWRAFERSEPTEAERVAYRGKLDAVRLAQHDGVLYGGMPAADLFAITIRLVASWLAAPPALTAAASQDPMSEARLRQHRKALVEAVRRITEPH